MAIGLYKVLQENCGVLAKKRSIKGSYFYGLSVKIKCEQKKNIVSFNIRVSSSYGFFNKK